MITDRLFIFLCGGQGKRFQSVCSERKPCPPIYNRPMYKWVFESIFSKLEKPQLLLAIHDDDNGKSILYNAQKEYNFDIDHVKIHYYTRGPIETCKLCINNPEKSFWVLDNDIIYDHNIDWTIPLQKNQICILIQEMPEDERKIFKKNEYSPYSHVLLDENNNIIDIIEKKYISEYIVLGAYGFGSGELYLNLFDKFIDSSLSKNEWFMSSLIKVAIDNKILVKSIKSSNSVAIGTPEQVETALLNNVINPRPLRWIFDLDQTLVSLPRIKNNYSTVEPLNDKIKFVRYLYDNGHYIIIYTARHMKTCNGDVELAKQKIGKITEDTLQKFGIPYHELIYGKPYGDVYVDDKSTNPLHWSPEWLTGSIGFGWKNLLCEKSVHRKINKINDELCYKIADVEEAKGVLCFMEQCDKDILPHIPKIYNVSDYVNGKKKILMEWKNDTIIVGRLLSHDALTKDVFIKVLELLDKLHSKNVINPEKYYEKVFNNYYPKLLGRLNKYSIYKNFNLKQDVIKNFFDSYKPQLCGCIHGDFWMSNMLWSHQEHKLYIIDMRGRLGNEYTIVGDKFYDYSKLYQSIVGFDSLIFTGNLTDKNIKTRLEDIMISHLKLSLEDFEKIKKITAFLILGSIPFHEELELVIPKLEYILKELWPEIIDV